MPQRSPRSRERCPRHRPIQRIRKRYSYLRGFRVEGVGSEFWAKGVKEELCQVWKKSNWDHTTVITDLEESRSSLSWLISLIWKHLEAYWADWFHWFGRIWKLTELTVFTVLFSLFYRFFQNSENSSVVSITMRFTNGVLDVVMIFLTIALCFSCTGTWFDWRRDLKNERRGLLKWGDRLLFSDISSEIHKIVKFHWKDLSFDIFLFLSRFFHPFMYWLPRQNDRRIPWL